ncbi:hypothetical protein [Photobacterium atrarenae]|uniref:DUF2846 domain-containing protein n=1 Tax=Photobacterium atrarenae TaxID=865757 RepID=A0ABY5GM78_9GAMM|nr:hypothetical protein [Photobacterium atrarenae]UTV29891.1 hypothetical protein NNL38_23085 [Photobacterium atrarenae]
MRVFIFILISQLLIGCSSGVYVSLPEKYEPTEEQPVGFLAGSLSATTVWPASGEGLITTLYIRQRGDDAFLTVASNHEDTDFDSETLKGQLFYLPLPAGEYELFSIGFKGSNGNKSIRSKSSEELGLVFTIAPGQVTYIGQFITSSLVAKSKLWNIEYPSGYGYITYSDAQQRDQPLLREMHPELEQLTFTPVMLAETDVRLTSSRP